MVFGWFKKPKFEHDQLGEFHRRGKTWEGEYELKPKKFVDLNLDGSREEPFPELVKAALALPKNLPLLMKQVAAPLKDHLEPYQEDLADPDSGFAEEFGSPQQIERVLSLETLEQALDAVSIIGIELYRENGDVRTLILIDAPWDPEHTLGAFFEDGNLLELNASM